MDPSPPSAGEHRFLVNSAEEAVRAIRDRLGEAAQVTSVRRVERGRVAGLFRGAQLEVMARSPAAPAAGGLILPLADSLPASPWDPPLSPAPEPPGPELPAASDNLPSTQVVNLLRRAGIDQLLLTRLRGHAAWEGVEGLPLPQAMAEVAALLRKEHAARERPPLTARLAFVGMAGAGSTSLLCKHLARCVFNLGKPAAVYRLETDRPNPIDGLGAICELWGVPLLRSEQEVHALGEGVRLYVDIPGLGERGGQDEAATIAARLEKLSIGSRVFVLNAAYEIGLLKGLCRAAEILGCRYLGFSHLDELVHWGKMWEFLLHRDLHVVGYSLGAHLPGDFTEDALEATLRKTFT